MEQIFIEFFPNVGMNNIKFGMSRIEVRKIMKSDFKQQDFVRRNESTECYFNNSLQFSFESDGTLSFIEVASPPPVFLTILGMSTWDISGNELLEKLKKIDKINEDDSESEYNPVFMKNIITLWELDEQYDKITNETVPRWGAIGIGNEKYYAKYLEIISG